MSALKNSRPLPFSQGTVFFVSFLDHFKRYALSIVNPDIYLVCIPLLLWDSMILHTAREHSVHGCEANV